MDITSALEQPSRPTPQPVENIFTRPSQTISKGITTLLEPPLKNTKAQLDELQVKQQELVERLHRENMGISEVQYSQELQAMFIKVKSYHAKLQAVKKDMRGLHERSQKLKKRALRLREIKESKPSEEVIISKATSVISIKAEASVSAGATQGPS